MFYLDRPGKRLCLSHQPAEMLLEFLICVNVFLEVQTKSYSYILHLIQYIVYGFHVMYTIVIFKDTWRKQMSQHPGLCTGLCFTFVIICFPCGHLARPSKTLKCLSSLSPEIIHKQQASAPNADSGCSTQKANKCACEAISRRRIRSL